MSEEEDDDLGIKAGSIIDSSKHEYVVEKLLGEGGFGAVYKVHLKEDEKQCFAMKVEKKLDTRRHSKLKMEIAILKLVSNERKNSHFTSISDRGKKDKEGYFFLVMQLVGKSLQDLKAKRPGKVFSLPTGMGTSMQCLEACQDLHKYGYIHRDLKPANYAIGQEKQLRIVYILDFGIARKITNDKDELKTPREKANFKGTIPFASVNCHKGKELGFRDDCESWFYLLLDLIIATGLPWRKMSDKNDVLKMKEECRTTRREKMLNGAKCKEELSKIIDYIDSLKYFDRVDYDFIYDLLKEGAKVAGGSVDDPYDWEKE